MSENVRGLVDDVTDFSVQLRSYDGRTVDVSDLVASVQLFQSIYTPAITAKLTVSDQVNFLNSLPMNGEEAIRLKFNSVSSQREVEIDLFIFAADDINIDPSLANMTYTLYACTYEALTDLYKPVQKAYDGEISAIVRDIYNTYLRTGKPLDIEQTQGRTTLIIPKLTPFQALNFLKKRAISPTYDSSVFMSFETLDGFMFKTVERMIKDGRDNPMLYRLMHASTSGPANAVENHIVEMKQHRKFDTLEELNTGYFRSNALRFNLIDKSQETIKFKLRDEYPNWETLSGKGKLDTALHTEKFMQDFDENSARRFAFVYDQTRPEPSVADKIGAKSSYITNLLQNQFEVVIPGNAKIIPGSVLRILVPNLGDGESTTEQRMDGLFFVADVTHNILNKTKFYTKLLCYKDSYTE